MPELPEVETVARGLRARIVGEVIVGVEVFWPRSVASHSVEAFADGLVGQAIVDVGRRGKYVVLSLSGHGCLLVHLRMTGRLLLEEPEEGGDPDAQRYTRVLWRLCSGRRLRFWDIRKFGRVHWVAAPEEALAALGPEPLSVAFTVDALRAMLRARRRQIKPLLLDQHFLAGLGNIYVDEALWEARIHPARRAHTLSDAEVARLHAAIVGVLGAAVRGRGTTLRDYRSADNRPGDYQHELVVYGREGQPCRRCGHPIVRTVIGGRGTRLCPICQPEAVATPERPKE
ncbi:MAG TPA: DNA-formamidopyrimidine glycosylase [Chloroflexi bacterium]|jgi:formamidopyrimidine-DNA glycosylase|nr:DNA-formamidopyrimidine glycosylase [Chloroflexota bacterium]